MNLTPLVPCSAPATGSPLRCPIAGPRAVPARSGLQGSLTFGFSEDSRVWLRAASRDGSRSDPERDAALSAFRISDFGFVSGFGFRVSDFNAFRLPNLPAASFL